MKAYLDFWRRCFDYKGVSTRREFWLPFGIHVAIAAVIVMLILIETYEAGIVALILAAYLILSAVPFISLSVRRLHDVGKSGWWFFLWFALGIGTIFMIILAFRESVLSAFNVIFNDSVSLYGPPPLDFDYSTTEETDFDPADNIEVDVYGPPPMDNEIQPAEEP